MMIDMHTYVGQPLFGPGCTAEELLAGMERSGVSRSVICPVKTTDPFFEGQNLHVALLQQRYPDRFLGFARVDPHLGERSLRLLERCVREYGLRGLLLHPWEETVAANDEVVFPLAGLCEELDVPLMIEAGYPWLSHCFQIADLASRFPKLPVIMTGGGSMDSSGYSAADVDYCVARTPNLLLCTGGDFSDEGIENKPAQLGPGRILFGSHSPYLDLRMELYRIERATLSETERGDIFSGAAKRLLGLEG